MGVHAIDMTGQRFGRLLVLERDGSTKHGTAIFSCQCDCGNKKSVRGTLLRNGSTQSCGCLNRERTRDINFEDLTGRTFGKWQVLEYHSSKLGNSVFKCKCTCGKIALMIACNLKSGHSKGCKNCSARERSLEYGRAAKNRLFSEYKRGARDRGYCFDLSFEKFVEICEQNCVYCNTPPYKIKQPGICYQSGNWTYNGIDRIDNEDGYTESNCVACCTICNWMKMDTNKDEFLEHIKKIDQWTTEHALDYFKLIPSLLTLPIQCACSHREKGQKYCTYCREHGYPAKRNLYFQYRNSADKKGRVFTLSFERFVKICEQRCAYCNSLPHMIKWICGPSAAWKYNGVDRVDNGVGYIESNCITACKACNRMKRNMNRDVFIKHVKKIARYQSSKEFRVYSLSDYAKLTCHIS